MSTTTPQIVHTLNELIVHVETQVIVCPLNQLNDYKRALGQLKAARTSIIHASAQEVTA